MGNAITFTEENFEEHVLRSETPVLVDYWAPWPRLRWSSRSASTTS